MQTLRDPIKIGKIVVRAINSIKRVERFTAHGRVFRDPRPKTLRFGGQIPFRGQAREIDFAVGLLARGALGGIPQTRKLGIGGGLPRLLGSERLVGQAQIFRVPPGAAPRPALEARPVLGFGKSVGYRDGWRRIRRDLRRKLVHPL
jgi:hypothetical protein